MKNPSITMSRLSFAALLAVSLAACTTTSPDVVQRHEAQRMSVVQDATVLSVRPVTVEGNQSGVGGVAGGVVGAVAGSSIGGHRDSIVGGVLGAVVGSVIGNAVERNTTREQAVEVLVQMRNGERRSVVQAVAGEQFAIGEPVVLVTTGGRTRVSRAPGAPSYSPSPAYAPAPYPSQGPQPVPAYPSSYPVPSTAPAPG